MRLIDADALKNKLTRLGWTEENGFKNRYVLDDIIDNASTVDTDEIYKKGYHNGFFATHGEPERPQGEWIKDNWGMYHCNYCTKEKQQLFNNFCGNCGADMGGKEE